MLPVAVILVGVLAPARAQLPGPAEVSELHWLTGCWEQRAGSLVVEEQWQRPRAGTMLGLSRTTRGDSLLGYEFMRIFSRGDTLLFAAQPSGQAPAEFIAGSRGPSMIIFENPAHDFPQRVQYFASAPDSLVGRIDGVAGGMRRTVEFRYARTACPERDSAVGHLRTLLPAGVEIEAFIRAALEDRLAARSYPDRNLVAGDSTPALREEMVGAGLRLSRNALPRIEGHEFRLIRTADAQFEAQRCGRGLAFLTVDRPRIMGDSATVWLGVDVFPENMCCCTAEAHFRRAEGPWVFCAQGTQLLHLDIVGVFRIWR